MNNLAKVSEYMSHKNSVRKIVEDGFSKVFAYPQNDAREVAKIMMDIKIDKIPVLFSPWNKKLVGFIELNKLSAFLND